MAFEELRYIAIKKQSHHYMLTQHSHQENKFFSILDPRECKRALFKDNLSVSNLAIMDVRIKFFSFEIFPCVIFGMLNRRCFSGFCKTCSTFLGFEKKFPLLGWFSL